MKTSMSRWLNLLGICGTCLALTGCVIAIGGTRKSEHAAPPVVITDSADAATIAEIDAAAQLNMDNGRTHALAQIAERPALSPAVQVHLINVAYRCLDFENNKVHVLSIIIGRADFGDATRHAIVSQLNKLSFDNNRQHLLGRINDRVKDGAAH